MITEYIKESEGVIFMCPANTVMTGRWHENDENGPTMYQYATLKAIDSSGNVLPMTIEVTDIKWSGAIKESDGILFQAPENRVIVGRQHSGDENGWTKYATAIVKANGEIVPTISIQQTPSIKESASVWFVTDAYRIIVGRCHIGDENGMTFYLTAELVYDSTLLDPAPKGTYIIPNIRSVSSVLRESESDFMCPVNTVITGRWHDGDENGETTYQYATLKAINTKGEEVPGNITVENIIWHAEIKESKGDGFDAPVNRVIVGRRHRGDENGNTQYATAVVKFNGYPTVIKRYTVSEIQIESNGAFVCDKNYVMTGRHHYGDENDYTYYGMGIIFCGQYATQITYPFDLIVSLHENEEYFPMIPSDYIILSRFRQHISGGSDLGYDKNTGDFVNGNSHDMNFYNVPVSVIKKYHSTKEHYRLFNLRPRDEFRLKDGKTYFIQPFANLYGDTDPNGRVPVYVNELNYNMPDGAKMTYVDFWLFFGYNAAPKFAATVHMSHQGDWEHIMVKMVDNKVVGAWLSAHTSNSYTPVSNLQVTTVNGRQRIVVYCAIGSHALYNRPDRFDAGWVIDETSYAGYKWLITDRIEHLGSQQWREYAGAWGEVGLNVHSTGPLGAWFKRFNYWWESRISLMDHIQPTDLAIVADQYYLSSEQPENGGFIFEAPENMVMVGRKHTGDELGNTICLYASLKAVDYAGFTVEGEICIVNSYWTEPIKENDSVFHAPDGYVILGRQHTGDENGMTRYKIGKITFNGIETSILSTDSFIEYQLYPENMAVFFKTEPYCLYTGRCHQGDEKGDTYNIQGLVIVRRQKDLQ